MYLFPIVFGAALIFSYVLKSGKKNQAQSLDEFLEREAKANATPKKDITNLDYITLSLNMLPFISNPSNSIEECENTIKKLSESKILNLNGISNTDLKLSYGVGNLSRLSQYDENYSIMHRTFVKWGRLLKEEGYLTEAVTVLEYALSLGCDAKNIFLMLKELYADLNIDKLEYLKLTASTCNNPLKESILKELNQ